jgi:transmembrane sensor
MADVTGHVRALAEQVDAGYDAQRTNAALATLHTGLCRRRARRLLGVSTAGALCVLAVAFWTLRSPSEVAKQLPTMARLGLLFSLADGSTVTALDQGSRVVTHAVSPHRVELDLVAGGAQFDVAPDQAREFRVNAGRVTVVVLGTQFTIKLRGEHAQVAVQRGQVRVDWERGQQLLTLGERGTFPPTEARGESTPVAEPEAPALAPGPAPAAIPPSVDWRSLARKGGFVSAYRVIRDKARPAALADLDDLLLAADVARGAGHAAEAVPYLNRAMALHNGDSRAAVAAFTMGRIRQADLDDPAGAAAAFAQVRTIAPQGPLAEDALAREVECRFQAGDKMGARTLAEEYLRTWPAGSRSRAVRHFGGLP